MGRLGLKIFARVVGLDPDLKRPVGKYSMGMRQRLGIAQAIMEAPDLLILDEHMNGLDNQGASYIRSVLKELKAMGKKFYWQATLRRTLHSCVMKSMKWMQVS